MTTLSELDVLCGADARYRFLLDDPREVVQAAIGAARLVMRIA